MRVVASEVGAYRGVYPSDETGCGTSAASTVGQRDYPVARKLSPGIHRGHALTAAPRPIIRSMFSPGHCLTRSEALPSPCGACPTCGDRKSEYDAYFRDALVTDERCRGHPVARSKFYGELRRSVASNQSRFADDLTANSLISVKPLPDGRLEEVIRLLPVEQRFEVELEFILRGLTRYANPKWTVAADAMIQVGQLTRVQAVATLEHAKKLGPLQGPFMRDNHVVEWAFQCANENLSMWWSALMGVSYFFGLVQSLGREPIRMNFVSLWDAETE